MTAHTTSRLGRGVRGNAIIEISLMAPWIFLLFSAVFDFGFYAYALIATENAAHAAALYTSSTSDAAADSAGACQYALGEMQALPNIKTAVTSCNALPLQVTARALDAAESATGAPATRVTVTYQTVRLIPLPFMSGQLTFTRIVEMPVNIWG